jgi:hypothetical protein
MGDFVPSFVAPLLPVRKNYRRGPAGQVGESTDSLASWQDSAYIRAILIGFAGRTKEKEWAENPLFSFVNARGPKRRENRPA